MILNNAESTNDWQAQFFKSILNTELQQHIASFAKIFEESEVAISKKDAKRWHKQINQLPLPSDLELVLGDTVGVRTNETFSLELAKKTEAVLKNFMPWRKGPFQIFDTFIDTEWRSDFKWKRVRPHIPDLTDKTVLDVGCGSGYHMFRMKECGAKQVVGIDPTLLFFFQFHCIKRYFPELNLHFIPCTMEQMPNTTYFDCVFSMGVLYHRHDPIKFLKELKQQIKKDGTLILETLVVDGDETTVLVPQGRYAQMRNVWFIPSVAALILWLRRVGFSKIECVDLDITSVEEQRATQWMDGHSLSDFLDPNDHSLTIEGYPAPKRAVLIAQ